MSKPLSGRRASDDALLPALGQTADLLLILLIAAGVCLFILWPMLCIVLRSLNGENGPTMQHYMTVIRNYGDSLLNSVFVALSVSVITTLISLCAALYISTGQGWKKRVCLLILLMTMVSPPFVSSLAYIQLYGRRGWITYRLLGLRWNPYNCWGVIAMESLSFTPVSTMLLTGILERTDPVPLLSARDLGASRDSILYDMILPAMKPGILASLLLCFVRSLADYGTPVIIGGRFSTLASEIYLQLVGFSDLEKASAMNILLMIPAVFFFFFYRRFMEQIQQSGSGTTEKRRLEFSLSGCRSGPVVRAVSGVYFVTMSLQYFCIFISAVSKHTRNGRIFTMEYLSQLYTYNADAMLRSVEYALITAVAGTVFAMLLSYYVVRRQIPGSRLLDCAATMPYMIPGSCFGIGYILAFNHEPLKLTGTALIVLANMLFKQLPTSSKICAASLTQISTAEECAARDLGAGRLRVLFDVILPEMRPAFLSCFVYHFSSSMTTAGAILFLINPGKKLAVFRLFDAVCSGDYGLASAIAAQIILIVLAAEGLVFLLLGKTEEIDVS